MGKRDCHWLSIEEIARLWAVETGERPEAVKRDLEDWFAEFNRRDPSAHQDPDPSDNGPDEGDDQTIDLLMGLLGGRHIRKQTLKAYCKEKNRDLPHFWFAGDGETLGETPEPTTLLEPPSQTAEQSKDALLRINRPATETGGEAPPDIAPDTFPLPTIWTVETAENRWHPRGAAGQGPAAAMATEVLAMEATWPREERHRGLAMGPSSRAMLISGALGALAVAVPVLVVLLFLWLRAFESKDFESPTAERSQSQSELDSTLDPDIEATRAKVETLSGALEVSKSIVARLQAELAAAKRPSTAQQTTPIGATEETSGEVAFLQARLSAAEQRNAALDRELDASRAEYTGLLWVLDEARQAHEVALQEAAAEAEAQRQDLAAARDHVAALNAEVAIAKQRIATLDDALDASQSKTTGLARELAEARRNHEAVLLEAAAEAESQRQQLALALQASSAQTARYKRDLTSAEQRNAALESELDASQAKYTGLLRELDEAQRNHKAALLEAAAEAESQRHQLDLALQASSAQTTGYKKDLTAANQRIATLGDALNVSQTEAAVLAQELTEAKQVHEMALQKAASEVEIQQQDLGVARDRIAVLDAVAMTAKQRIASLDQALSASRAESVGLTRELVEAKQDHTAALQEAISVAESHRQELALALQATSAQTADYKKDLTAAERRIAALDDGLNASQTESAALAQELAEAQRNHEAALLEAAAEAESQRQQLDLALQVSSAQTTGYKKDLTSAEQRNAALESELDASQAKYTGLLRELDEAQRNHEAALLEAAAEAESQRHQLDLALQASSAQTTGYKKDLMAAERRIATLDSELDASRAEYIGLLRELDEARLAQEVAQQEAAEKAEKQRQDSVVAQDRIAVLDTEVMTAMQQNAALDRALKASRTESTGLTQDLAEAKRVHEAALQETDAEAYAKLQELNFALQASSAKLAGYKKDLTAAEKRIAALDDALNASQTESAALAQELAEAKQVHKAALLEAAAEAESQRQEIAAALDRNVALNVEITTDEQRIASLNGALRASQAESAALAQELAETKQVHEMALQEAAAEAEAQQAQQEGLTTAQDLIAALVAEAADAAPPVTAVDAEVDAVHGETAIRPNQRQPLLSDGRHERSEPSTRVTQIQSRMMVDSPTESVIQQVKDLPPPPLKPKRDYPEDEAAEEILVLAPKAQSHETTSSAMDVSADAQMADSWPTAGGREPVQPQVTVDANKLIANPVDYRGREIVVTGSVMRLLQRYLLLSNSENRTFVVEVAGVHPKDQTTLDKAIYAAGLLGLVRVQMRGKILGDSTTSYYFVASDVTLVE